MKKINMTGKKAAVAAMAICAVMAVGGAVAYFTDVDSAKNKIEIGNVHIDLDEPLWDSTPDTDSDGIPDTADKIVPGQTIPKDPRITNTGKNDAYVYLTVSVPKANVFTANIDGTLKNNGKASITQLFNYAVNDGWKLMSTDTSAADKNVYVYGYEKSIKAGDVTSTLFDSVTFVNVIEGQGLEDNVLDIDIDASAIQAGETGTMEEAYQKFLNQNA